MLSEPQEDALKSELSWLLNESETLQRDLASHLLQQRILTSLSEKISNSSDSMLFPLETVSRMAAEEAAGLRRAGSGSADATPRTNPPILVSERDARDDVLALKSVALLDTAATALHEALRTLKSTRALRTALDSSTEGDTLLTASAEQMAAALEADSQPAVFAGQEGRRPLLKTLVAHVAAIQARDPEAVWQELSSKSCRQELSPEAARQAHSHNLHDILGSVPQHSALTSGSCVTQRQLAYADICCRMLSYADVC
jgi:hypothetical protein